MINIIEKLKQKKIFIAVIFFIIIVNFLFSANYVMAADYTLKGFIGDAALGVVGAGVMVVLSMIAYIVTAVIGLLITLVVALLIQVAQFGNIINVPTVINGWVVIRDLCNMFFILILLVISFATILRIETYSWKKLLPKLLIMAVLINFSKTIFGLLIDFSQVIMLTFVNAFNEGGGWFIKAFQVNLWFNINTIKESGDLAVTTWSTAVSIIAGVIAAIITLIVVSIMLAILVMRIIMLWIYTIFSPLVFMGFAVPGIQKYTGKIWEDFTKQLVVGPVLAFFIWLALSTAESSSGLLAGQNLTRGAEVCVGIGAFFCQDSFQTFLIVIGLLFGGLMIAQQMGGAAAAIAGKGLDWAKKVGTVPFKSAQTAVSFAADKIHQRTGVDLNIARAWNVLKEKRLEKQQERYGEGQIAAGRAMTEGGTAHGLLAMTGSPGDAYDMVTHTEGIVPRGLIQRFYGGRRLKDEADAMEPDLMQAEFESEFMGANLKDRNIKIKKLDNRSKSINKEIKEEEDKEEDKKDNEKIENLKKEKNIIKRKLDFAAGENLVHVFSQKEKDGASEKAVNMRKEYNKNKPRTTFEARAAEQKLVANKMSKIKDISAPSELLRILQDAIRQHDKTMVKAVTLKMTKDYNDNEFLQPLAGDTSHIGLKKLMRDFSTKGSDNYAGFDQQEAFALGSQIAELNKATNHWGATSSYLMENGRWRETTDAEHVGIRTIETGKIHPQQLVRVVNRLGFGKHKGDGSYSIDVGGLITLKQLDNKGGRKQLKDNMTMSTAQYLNDNMEILKRSGLFGDLNETDPEKSLLAAIKERAAQATGKVDFDEQFEDVNTRLQNAIQGISSPNVSPNPTAGEGGAGGGTGGGDDSDTGD